MKVAIVWYGAEGQSSYRYYIERGDDVTIVTPRIATEYPLPRDAQSIIGEDAFDHLEGFDLVVRSAAVRPDRLVTNAKVWSSTNEFFAQCPAPIIGVTGTKGKGTTASVIASILRTAGKRVYLVGNIGVPALDVLALIQPDDIVVFELSSFQLWDIQMSPHVAVVLMIEPDHLDVHRDMAEYVAAKAGICRFQSAADTVIYHPHNPHAQIIAEQSAGHRYKYANDGARQIYIRDGAFYRDDERICGTDAVQLRGGFNLENACAAIAACAEFLDTFAAVDEGLRNFTGLPHRLKFVRDVNGVKWFDDSIATTPGSAIAAMNSFAEPKVLILGGSDKGADYTEVVAMAQRTGSKVIAIGQTGARIAKLCEARGVAVRREQGRMPVVVQTAVALAKPGDVVILSPASASFDQYNSYSDRGDQFIAAVERIPNHAAN
jgi:UDP-N-acetylmuramoylalanine--D-glutamate ligase